MTVFIYLGPGTRQATQEVRSQASRGAEDHDDDGRGEEADAEVGDDEVGTLALALHARVDGRGDEVERVIGKVNGVSRARARVSGWRGRRRRGSSLSGRCAGYRATSHPPASRARSRHQTS